MTGLEILNSTYMLRERTNLIEWAVALILVTYYELQV